MIRLSVLDIIATQFSLSVVSLFSLRASVINSVETFGPQEFLSPNGLVKKPWVVLHLREPS